MSAPVRFHQKDVYVIHLRQTQRTHRKVTASIARAVYLYTAISICLGDQKTPGWSDVTFFRDGKKQATVDHFDV